MFEESITSSSGMRADCRTLRLIACSLEHVARPRPKSLCDRVMAQQSVENRVQQSKNASVSLASFYTAYARSSGISLLQILLRSG